MAESLEPLRAALADRYRVERELGTGGMATVYLAEDLKHHRQVAIKVLKPELAAVLGAERFVREIEISARLRHPHILPLYDSGEAGGFLFYVMPFVEGESLRDRLAREKQLPLDDALQIAREVADALSYAHSHNVVHRDIKPENVLLESGHAVVADFGIARAISAAGGDKLTETGLAIGTPSYMSPEQAAGSRDFDGRSDVYSLGCVVYEMLAGQPPFTGPTVESVVHQHLAAAAQPVTAIRETVPGPVASAISRALAKAPADRFASAAQFGQAIAQSATPVTARRMSKRAAAIGTAVVLVLLAAAYLLARWSDGTAEPGRDIDLPRVAVLPFENLGPPEDEYFADGITDEVMTRLAGLSGLAVIAPQTAMQYKGTTKSSREIAGELDVQYLLRGRVRWQRLASGPSRVRVTPQLIQVSGDRLLWASDFDEVLEDVFRVQGQIAVQVSGAIGVTLLSREQEAAAQQPTKNLGAYEHYLRGNVAFRSGLCCTPALLDAIRAYDSAVALDPGFAAAYARLSVAHGGVFWVNLDPDRRDDHLAKQQLYAERALELDSALPEAHWAIGQYHLWGAPDWRRGLQEFKVALAAEPNNSLFLNAESAIYKRTGDFSAYAQRSARASDLDPLARGPATEAGYAYVYLRRYDEGQRYLERFAAITGEYDRLAYLRLARDGDPVALRAWLDTTLGSAGLPRFVALAAHGGSGFQQAKHVLVRVLGSDCEAAIPLVPNLRERDWQRYYGVGMLYDRCGRRDRARIYYDSARVRMEGLGSAAVRVPPGLVYAALGRRDEAVRAAEQLLQQDQRNKNADGEISARMNLVEVYVLVGEYDAALEQWSGYSAIPRISPHPSSGWIRCGTRYATTRASRPCSPGTELPHGVSIQGTRSKG